MTRRRSRPPRIGIVTGGEDAPGLNTVIRATVMAAAARGWEAIGITGGFEGLLPPLAHRPLAVRDTDALLFRGGTILGTSSRGRFTDRSPNGGRPRIQPDVVAKAAEGASQLGIEALICIGGNGLAPDRPGAVAGRCPGGGGAQDD